MLSPEREARKKELLLELKQIREEERKMRNRLNSNKYYSEHKNETKMKRQESYMKKHNKDRAINLLEKTN